MENENTKEENKEELPLKTNLKKKEPLLKKQLII